MNRIISTAVRVIILSMSLYALEVRANVWINLSSGIASNLSALACDTNGILYAGGSFTNAGDLPATNIARWDGIAWTNLGLGLDGAVAALVCDTNGILYAGGSFTNAGNVAATNIARWDGTAWTNLGLGLDGAVAALVCDTNGILYASGSFTNAGNVAATNIARWDGTAWTNLGLGLDGAVAALACDTNGILYAGGSFTSAGGLPATNIARWDGTAWTNLGLGVDGAVAALACDTNGILYAGGSFTSAGGVPATNISRWDGNVWTNLGLGLDGAVAALACDTNGILYAGGSFTSAGGVPATNIARWDGTAWTNLGLGLDGAVAALACDTNGILYAGGSFTNAGGVTANRVAKWSPGAGIIGITPATLNYAVSYSNNPATHEFIITNIGSAGFSYTSEVIYSVEASNWFSITMPTGIVGVGEAQSHTGTVTVAGLNVGTYYATGVVSSATATNSPQDLIVTLTVTQANQTITFPNPGSQITTNTVRLSATASSGLPVTNFAVSGPGTIADLTNLTFTGSGVVSIVAAQAGNENWNPAPNATNTFTVTKATAQVTLTNLNQNYDGTARSATATTVPTDLTVTITYNGNVTPPVNVGSYAVTGTVSSTMYQGTNTGTLGISKGNQTITFPNPGSQLATNTVHLSATASSDQPVWNFTVVSGPGVISGVTNLTFTNSGVIRIFAAQAGNANWNPAPNVTNTFTVSKVNQTITFPNPGSQFATNMVHLSATASSGLPVTNFAVSGPGTIADLTNLTFTGSGVVSVVAAQAGNANWNPAPSVTNTFTVSKISQTITFPMITNQITTNTVRLSATASSGLPVTNFAVIGSGTIADLTNLTFTGSGLVSVVAAQAGNESWNSAPNVTNIFTVTKAAAQVTLTNLNQTYDGAARIVTATTMPSDLTVIITYNGSVTPPVNVGSYAVTGTINSAIYQGVKTGTLVVGNQDHIITFPPIPDQVLTNGVNLSATASSGLPVIFAIGAGQAVITNGTSLTFTAVGMVSIVASQDGNENYLPAPSVTNTFLVTAVFKGIVNGDFDGDRKADPAVYDERTGLWIVKLSAAGYAPMTHDQWIGSPGYVPAVGDYDGDRLSDPAVYEESLGNWIVLQSATEYVPLERHGFLGASGWTPVTADYDGDRKADYAVYQEETGTWKIRLSSVGYSTVTLNSYLGAPGFTAVSADYDGDGLADPAVYNRGDSDPEQGGTWIVLLSGSGYAPVAMSSFGGKDWDAVPGDYDGDGLADPAVFQYTTGDWIILLSSSWYGRVDLPHFLGGPS